MTKDVDAIYENGAFRLVGDADIPLPDGTRVRLSVEPLNSCQPGDVLELAASVYAGLSESDIADVETMATDWSHFFSRQQRHWMNTAVLDTDILSAIMRQDSAAVSNAKQYLESHARLTISIITRYEVLRGLMAKNATTQIANFNTLCGTMEVLQLTDTIVVRAASTYGQLRQSGNPIGDADILIAATCLENGYDIVTNNTSHFSRIPDLIVQNWLAK